MRQLFLLGWLLIVAAFFAAVAETSARMEPGVSGMVLSAHELWYAMWPGSLVVTQIRIENLLGPWFWDSVVRTILMVPAWALTGVPGAALAWFCRPGRGQARAADHEEDSLFLYDNLAKHAEEEEEEQTRVADEARPDEAVGGRRGES